MGQRKGKIWKFHMIDYNKGTKRTQNCLKKEF